MSDLAKNLLSRYYGLGEELNSKGFVPIHECIAEHRKGETKELLITEEEIKTSLPTNEENLSDEESRVLKSCDKEDCLKSGVTNESYETCTRALDHVEDPNDARKDFDNFDTDLGTSVLYNVYENAQFASGGEEQSSEDVRLSGTRKVFDTLGSKVEERNEQNSTCAKDAAPGILRGSMVARKESENSSSAGSALATLPPSRSGELICNETFADCSDAGLVTLPLKMLEKYPSLQMLYLENNMLTELPIELFASLRNLEWLDIRNNQLATLPPSIKSHPSLETLLLEGNKIETLPLELCLVPKLKTLRVTGNPLIVPSKDIVTLGCTAILGFLRTEWNKLHPDQVVKLEKKEIKPRPSTILCYQSPRRNKVPAAIKRSSGGGSISNRDVSKRDASSTREKSGSYKASNRQVQSTPLPTNDAMKQRLFCISKMREIFAKQTSILQKVKDETVLKEWRRDKRSFGKALEKAMQRNEDDIPFAIDVNNYSTTLKRKPKSDKRSRTRKMSRSKRIEPSVSPLRNINKEICELVESINQLPPSNALLNEITPRAEQTRLNNEIKKISQFQDQIQNLRKYNDATTVPPSRHY